MAKKKAIMRKVLCFSIFLAILMNCLTPCIAVNNSTENNASSICVDESNVTTVTIPLSLPLPTPSQFKVDQFISANATNHVHHITTLTLSSKTIDIAGSWAGTLYQPPGGFAREYPFYLNLYQSGTEVWGTSRIEWGSYYAIMELSGSVSKETFSFTETKIIEQYLPSGIFFIKSVVLNCEGEPPKVMEGSWDCPRYNAKGTISVNKKSDFKKFKWDKNGHYYEIIKKDVDWNEAKEYAEKQEFEEASTGVVYEGYLATVTSPEENSWVVENLIAPIGKSKVYPWLGGYQLEGHDNPSEGWKWVTGEDWSWTNWKEGEPNDVNGYNERYLKIYPNGGWNDESCDGCEKWTNYILIEYKEIKKADLILLSSDISFTNPNPALGETVTIATSIHNIGDANAKDVVVQFFDNEMQIGSDQIISSITAGGTGTAQVAWPATKGSHDISVIIDPYNEIVEVDETNNIASKPTLIDKISDDFSTDSGMWSYIGDAYRDAANGYVVLTEDKNDQAGIIWFNHDITSPFAVEFKYKAGGGSGADGLVFMFYKQKNYAPSYGGSLCFKDSKGNRVPGYGIEFDNWLNSNFSDPSANHIALIKDSVNNHLKFVDDARTEDNKWHDVKIAVEESSITVSVDNEAVLTWEGTIDRTYSGLGFSGATGASNNWHIIDDVELIYSTCKKPIISKLTPPNSAILSSNDVLFSWSTSVNSTTEIYLKPEAETEFKRVIGDSGLSHAMAISNLTRNTNYEWYARSCSACGCAVSPCRTFYIDNGIVFTKDRYDFTVERDYDQHVSVSVKNKDSEPHELLVRANNPYNDLFVGFVGGGSIDNLISLNPGEKKDIKFVIHAQDSMLEDYTFTTNLTNLGTENITDYAVIHVNIRRPNIDFTITEVSTNPRTLVKTYKVKNRGDPITDFKVSLDDAIKDSVYLQPEINHGYLKTGDSIDVKAIPLFSEECDTIEGNIIAEGARESKSVPANFECPNGTELFLGHIDYPLYVVEINDWYCINNPEIDADFALPPGFNADDVIYGKLFIDFSLPWKRSDYAPHNVYITINGKEVGWLMNTIPEGRYSFEIDPSVFNYAEVGKAENKIHIHTEYPTYAHFVSNTHMRIQICLEELERWVCASTQEEANASLWEIPGIQKPSSNMNAEIISPSEGDSIALGESTLVKASVAGDYGDELYATVTATFSNSDLVLELKDDGIHDDGAANDGVYANTWVPEIVGGCEITVSANDCIASGSDNVITTVTGGEIVGTFKASYPVDLDMPIATFVGDTMTIPVTITNIGDRTWMKGTFENDKPKQGTVFLSYHIFYKEYKNDHGYEIKIWDDGDLIPIPNDIPPSESCLVDLKVTIPNLPLDKYDLFIDAVAIYDIEDSWDSPDMLTDNPYDSTYDTSLLWFSSESQMTEKSIMLHIPMFIDGVYVEPDYDIDFKSLRRQLVWDISINEEIKEIYFDAQDLQHIHFDFIHSRAGAGAYFRIYGPDGTEYASRLHALYSRSRGPYGYPNEDLMLYAAEHAMFDVEDPDDGRWRIYISINSPFKYGEATITVRMTPNSKSVIENEGYHNLLYIQPIETFGYWHGENYNIVEWHGAALILGNQEVVAGNEGYPLKVAVIPDYTDGKNYDDGLGQPQGAFGVVHWMGIDDASIVIGIDDDYGIFAKIPKTEDGRGIAKEYDPMTDDWIERMDTYESRTKKGLQSYLAVIGLVPIIFNLEISIGYVLAWEAFTWIVGQFPDEEKPEIIDYSDDDEEFHWTGYTYPKRTSVDSVRAISLEEYTVYNKVEQNDQTSSVVYINVHPWQSCGFITDPGCYCKVVHAPLDFKIAIPIHITKSGGKLSKFVARCPVDLEIIDPEGLIINTQINQIPEAYYIKYDINADDVIDDVITIPKMKEGNYRITVIPEPDSELTDTYTLEVLTGDTTTILAENVPISKIPAEAYIFKSGMNPLPSASFSSTPENPVVNQVITFNASSSSGFITNYEWDFGEGGCGTGKVVTHPYSNPGNYSVTLTVTDDDGAVNSTSKSVSVAGGLQQFMFLSTDNAVPITVDGTLQSSPYTASWTSGSVHSVNALSEFIAQPDCLKYVFTGWTGAVTQVYTLLPPTLSSGTYTANYKKQYYLTVDTEPQGIATISGEGWYDEGAMATTGNAPKEVTVGDEKYPFETWKVDGSPVSLPFDWVQLKMDDCHTVTASYREPGGTQVLWLKTYDFDESYDRAYAVATDSKDNIIVTGKSDGEWLTIKYDPNGNELWTKRYENGRKASGVAVDSNDNIIVVGDTDIGGTWNYLIIKYDPSGNRVWYRRLASGYHEYPEGVSVDSNDHIIVTGRSHRSTEDCLTVKINSNGDVLWTKYYDGRQSDEAHAVAVDSNDNIIVTGESRKGGFYGDHDYLTIKYDPNGNVLGTKKYDSGDENDDNAYGIAVDSNDNFIVTGYGYNGDKIVTIKYNRNGEELWEKTFEDGAYARGVAVDSYDNIVVAGESKGANDDFLTIKYDSNGNVLWSMKYDGGNDDHARGVAVDSENNIIVTGDTWNGKDYAEDYLTIKYGVSLTPNNPPNKPSEPSPSDGATGVSIAADLSWTGGDPDGGDTVTYDVYFGTSTSPPLVSNDQTGTTYDPGTLSDITKYYWKILATDNHGATTTGDLWDFFTTGYALFIVQSTNNAVPITIDGTSQSSPYTASWTTGAGHTVNALSEFIAQPDCLKYLFTGWTGAITQSGTLLPPTITPGTYTANYKKQYYLTVDTEPQGIATISGEGWYDQNAMATTGSAPEEVTAGGEKYQFETWKVDGSPVGMPFNWIQLKMDNCHTVTASYQRSSQLPPTNPTLTPDILEPQTAGTSITWTASATDSDGDTLYYRFWIKGPSTGNSWAMKRDWSTDNTWTWDTNSADIGDTDISVWIRDGHHEPASSYDLEKVYYDYTITGSAPSLVAEWHFDEGSGSTVKDNTGNGNDGIIHGATWVNGIKGNALKFDGNDDYVEVQDSSSLRITGNIKVEAWVNVEELGSKYHFIVSKHYTPAGYTLFINPANKFAFEINSQHSVASTTTPELGKWYHVIGTYDQSQLKIYVNDVLENTKGCTAKLATNNQKLRIGQWSAGGYCFKGIIDEVGIST